MSLLAADGVSIVTEGRWLLRGVSLSIRAGELLGLIGPNGAGKTTLLRVLAGLRKPDAGVIFLDGKALGRGPDEQLARTIAYLAQGAVCHWPLTVENVVMLGRLPYASGLRESGAAADRAAVAQAIAEVGVESFRGRCLDTLSAGERSRVMLARALATQPRVLLADEPTAALDLAHQLDVMVLLQELARRGIAVVVVLHDLGLAARFCHRLVLLHQGHKLAEGTPRAVLTRQRLAEVYSVEVRLPEFDGILSVLPWRRLAEGSCPFE